MINKCAARSLSPIFLLLSALLLSACNREGLEIPAGRYTGVEVDAATGPASSTQDVFAEAVSSERKSVQFNIVPIRATARSRTLGIALTAANTIELSIGYLNLPATKLVLANGCGTGATQQQGVSVCWKDQSLALDIRETATGKSVYSLTLRLLRWDETLSNSARTTDYSYSLDELLGRVKFADYAVAQGAERLYREKKNVSVALGNLLPHINIKSVATFLVMGPEAGILDAAGGLLPFLFPGNWFKWREAGHLYEAEKASFGGLRANEMNALHTMFYVYHRDRAVLGLIERFLLWEQQIADLIAQSEKKGTLPSGSASRFRISVIRLRQDYESMAGAVRMEQAALAQMAALPSIDQIEEPSLPGLRDTRQPSIDEFCPLAAASSLELQTLDHLIHAARESTKEVQFGFLDLANGSDIGFGTAATIAISKSRERELIIRKQELVSLIERRCRESSSELTTATMGFALAEDGLTSARSELERAIASISVGTATWGGGDFISSFVELIDDNLKFETDRLNFQHLYYVTLANLDRLTLQGYYAQPETAVPGAPSAR